MAGEEAGEVLDGHIGPGVKDPQDGSQGHLAETVVVAVGLAVGGEGHQAGDGCLAVLGQSRR
jgi:hypothetical protein